MKEVNTTLRGLLVGEAGLEPATSNLSGLRSVLLSYSPIPSLIRTVYSPNATKSPCFPAPIEYNHLASLWGGGMLGELLYQDLVARGRTLAVAKEWSAIANEFEGICSYKESYTRADLILFLNHLRQKELRPNTILKDLKAIKLLSQIQGWDFPRLSLGISPDVKRPTFTKDEIHQLIQFGNFTATELCYLALSTIYGLRRAEMATMTCSDFTSQVIRIYTAKGGKITTHLIPSEIALYLKAFKPYKKDALSHMFQNIIQKAGLERQGYGWHSIRRALATELVSQDINTLTISRFMRWSDASTKIGMLTIYAQKDQEKIDRKIFEAHPFLGFWQKR